MTSRNNSSLTLDPIKKCSGSVSLPGSKSISNRALLLAALSSGVTELHGLLDSDDISVMLNSLDRCGVKVERLGGGKVRVHGVYPFPITEADLFMGNAGTAIRPLTGALAIMGGNYTLSGVPRMHERPIKDLADALIYMGAQIKYLQSEGYPPIHIGASNINKNEVTVKGNVSSQFLTSLLMAAPLAARKIGTDIHIKVDGELISIPYINITLKTMQRFGVSVKRYGWQHFVISANAEYVSPLTFQVEGDASSASYFMALATLGGGPLKIDGAGSASVQGDIAFADVVKEMGATVQYDENSITVVGPGVSEGVLLRAFDRDFNHIPDAAMTAAVMALFADGPCLLRNIGSWRVKETDRIDAMHSELERLGAKVESGPDWLKVYPMEHNQWRSANIKTYDDHRMAMCFSLAAFGPVPVTILDPSCVSKTFPEYFDVYKTLVA